MPMTRAERIQEWLRLRQPARLETAAQLTRPARRPDPMLALGAGAVAALAIALAAGARRVGGRRRRRVRDVMVKDVVTIEPTATLAEAAQRMRDDHVGMLPIVQDGKVRGIVTDRDLVVRAMARGIDPATTPVKFFESDELVCAGDGWDVRETMAVMRECQIGRLPVVDDRNRLVGVVTLSSLALRAGDEDEAFATAREVARRAARAA
jgi:CBS domain-containing protein